VSGFPKVGSGFWADASSGDRHLRLFSSVTELGEVWLAREWADNLDDGKRRAERIATDVLKKLPSIDWKNSPG
jgi:hypothetical protein